VSGLRIPAEHYCLVLEKWGGFSFLQNVPDQLWGAHSLPCRRYRDEAAGAWS